ncbi:MAG: SIS domain-containing protein [Treponema sp.]|jgi:D-sedoheptulose 7-phosphate isomerase|nr:SIS domain-containing protein [Treponema sp.]
MDHLQQLIERYPRLSAIQDDIRKAYSLLEETFTARGKLLVAGNGGSSADAGHITGELMKGFVKKRPLPSSFISKLNEIDPSHAGYLGGAIQQGLPVIALPEQTALMTACLNDIDGDIIYAQQVYGYGSPGDVFLGISTSGNSKNIILAAITAKAKNLKTIALSGASGGALAKYADAAIIVPEKETYKIQELHLPVYHALCLMLEEHFFP